MNSIKSKEVVKNFNKLWDEQTKVSTIGKIIFKFDRHKIMSLLKYTDLTFDSNIVDVGCGTGGTLKMFRNHGFYNSIGIDATESSMKLCQESGFKRNKDVFQVDINKDKFNKKFDLAFAEGVIEHYVNIQPVVNNLCKLSKKYVLTTMPNLSSFSWNIFEISLKIMGRKHVDDFKHEDYEYINAFRKAGFKLVKLKNLTFGWVMLFEKTIKKNKR